MNTLGKLIAELCPDGVDYRAIGELGEFYSGLSGKSKEDFVDGNARFISYMNVFSNTSTKLDIDDLVRVSDSEKQNAVEYGDVLFTGSSETKEECGMASVITRHPCEKIYLNSFCFGFRLKDKKTFEPDFMKHLLRSDEIRKQISKTASGVTRFNVSKARMEKVCIPIPPLPVQKEIVRMLDDMAGLIDALEEELAARKKQYEWYRESLMGYDNNVPIGSIASIGECIQKIENIKWNGNSKTFHYIELSSIDNDTHRVGGTVTIDARTAPSRAQQIVQKDDVLFGTTRPLLRRYCMIPEALDGQICSTGFCVLRANTDKVLPSWLYYVISTNAFISQVERLQRGGGYPAIANSDLCSCKILLPSLAEQKQIVNALNYLDTLCNSITEGLPGEIALRKQQYEFYRDKLLTFKRKPEVA